jgi:26S proteasome regulatory subunit N9
MFLVMNDQRKYLKKIGIKFNLLKLAHLAVIVSRQCTERGAAISYLEGVIQKLCATREMRIEESIPYVKMQMPAFKLE